MNGYPEGSLEHNVPFIVASGLNATANELPLAQELRDNAILIKSELPPLESREADVLEAYFEQVDKKSHTWKGLSKDDSYRFRIKTLGRVRENIHPLSPVHQAFNTDRHTYLVPSPPPTKSDTSRHRRKARHTTSSAFALLTTQPCLLSVSRWPH